MNKQWFLVRDSKQEINAVLTMVPWNSQCTISFSKGTKKTLKELFSLLQVCCTWHFTIIALTVPCSDAFCKDFQLLALAVMLNQSQLNTKQEDILLHILTYVKKLFTVYLSSWLIPLQWYFQPKQSRELSHTQTRVNVTKRDFCPAFLYLYVYVQCNSNGASYLTY